MCIKHYGVDIMTEKVKKKSSTRHIPAYILLFLAKQNLYGAALLNIMQKELPYFLIDGAVIYRTMQVLEKEGSVKSYWETDVSGPARKWYEITDIGKEKLAEFKKDIEMRKKNLEFFLEDYSKLFDIES